MCRVKNVYLFSSSCYFTFYYIIDCDKEKNQKSRLLSLNEFDTEQEKKLRWFTEMLEF